MDEQIKEFLESLTDFEFIFFCLHFGYNEHSIHCSHREISAIIGCKPQSLYIVERLAEKLGNFPKLVSELNKYEHFDS